MLREILRRSALFCIISLTFHSGYSQEVPSEPWFSKSLVGMEIGPTGAQFGHSDPRDVRYCSNFDGKAMVRHAIAAGSQYVVAWVRDGDFAYYDSKLLPKAPGLGGRDPLQEAIDEAKIHGLPILAYCVVQQNGHYLKDHPEYEMRGSDGRPLGRFCLNSGYLEAMKSIVAEQLEYGIAGFHIDMLDQGFGPPYGCWCEHCKSRFEKRYGRPMPNGATWDDHWNEMLEFRYDTSHEFERSLADHVRQLNPKATVDFNYHGNPPFSFEVGQRPVQHAQHGDFVTGETGVWGFSALTVGLNAEFYRSARPSTPFQVAMQRGVRMYHDQTTRPLHDLRWELLTLLSHGAFVTIVDKTGFDGSLDPVTYERIGEAFRDACARRATFGHRPTADVGIFFSHRTRDWYGRENAGTYFQSFQGAHKALVYEHIPYGVLLDENISLESLQTFPIVLVPNAGILSDQEVQLFRKYVELGGNLIVTGMSGCLDHFGLPTGSSKLEELIGGVLVEMRQESDCWVSFPDSQDKQQNSIASNIPRNWPFLVRGPAVVYQPTSALAFGELYRPHRTTRQLEGKEGTDWPMSADSVIGPAALLHRFGQGQVLTFAASPDCATASEHSIVEARRLLSNGVQLLHPTPMARIDAPKNVEVVVTEDSSGKQIFIHFLAYLSPPQTTPSQGRPFIMPSLIEDLPLFRATVHLDFLPASVEKNNSSTNIEVDRQIISVLANDVHEVLTIRRSR